jgi:predicted CopG family antitoxin
MPKRVNVKFSDEVYGELAKIAKERGVTLSDVLRDAVTLEKYAADAKREGGRLLIERDGETRELLVR